jgi:hypothetical protein
VTAIGTMLKIEGRHAKRIKVYYSIKGIQWNHDDQVLAILRKVDFPLNAPPITDLTSHCKENSWDKVLCNYAIARSNY